MKAFYHSHHILYSHYILNIHYINYNSHYILNILLLFGFMVCFIIPWQMYLNGISCISQEGIFRVYLGNSDSLYI